MDVRELPDVRRSTPAAEIISLCVHVTPHCAELELTINLLLIAYSFNGALLAVLYYSGVRMGTNSHQHKNKIAYRCQ